MRAAGRAILLLSDEIERLHIDLWHARDRSGGDEEPEAAAPQGAAAAPEPPEEAGLGVTLRERLAMFRPSKAADR